MLLCSFMGPVLLASSHRTPAHLVSPVVAGPLSQIVNSDSGTNHAVNPVVSSSMCGPARTTAQSLRHRSEGHPAFRVPINSQRFCLE
ncbi:hypothetical protein EDB83DRAFT_710036 [Lactarius deliciosus]|nr:hypothetical protein EDB83DRAFT_710036 [Lactarius deliciosus]